MEFLLWLQTYDPDYLTFMAYFWENAYVLQPTHLLVHILHVYVWSVLFAPACPKALRSVSLS